VLHSLHLIDHYHLWISGNRLASIFFIELVQIWQMTPLSAILILASLQSIPLDLYDAAAVDGAGRWETLRRITLPLIRPGIAIAVVESFIISLNIFDQVYVLNGSSTTASSVMLETYIITFQTLDFGQGYAMSFMAVLVTMLVCLGLLKVIYRKVEF
jgi:multiple sugar transport system permease protein